jgi:hypothetical protein
MFCSPDPRKRKKTQQKQNMTKQNNVVSSSQTAAAVANRMEAKGGGYGSHASALLNWRQTKRTQRKKLYKGS